MPLGFINIYNIWTTSIEFVPRANSNDHPRVLEINKIHLFTYSLDSKYMTAKRELEENT